ncbi:hypothetical protein ACIBTP_08355 [Streptomyces avidinii]|uniref:hypothetical protein n=1 Tax=Streptomyces avidinii TaxID=1895 RepID=UPI003798B90F
MATRTSTTCRIPAECRGPGTGGRRRTVAVSDPAHIRTVPALLGRTVTAPVVGPVTVMATRPLPLSRFLAAPRLARVRRQGQ